jgi:hypothetical protein
MEHIQVPANLKEQTLGLFDKLVDEKKIFYDRGVSEHVTINGFDVSLKHQFFLFHLSLPSFSSIFLFHLPLPLQFTPLPSHRLNPPMHVQKPCVCITDLYDLTFFSIEKKYNFIISNILKGKPILPPNAPSRTSPTAKNNPFLNPNPEEIITTLGSSHRLLINKYCVFRPMTVVTTIAYKRQTEDLVESDVHAVWSVLCAFDSDGGGSSSNEGMGQSEAMMIYNCGVGAGSSQGHKHMQVLSLPEGGKSTWPSRAMSTHGKS